MRSFIAASLFAALVGLSSAQNIDPSSVALSQRQQWCLQQKTSCPLLCLQGPGNSASTSANDCDPKTLVFNCVCAKDGLTPNATEFSQTIPYFECTESNNQCVKNCGTDSTCANDCRTKNLCGAKEPTRVNSTSSGSMPSTTSGASAVSTDSSGSTVYSGFGSEPTATGNNGGSGSGGSSAGSLAVDVGAALGLGGLVAGLVGVGAVLL